MAGDREEIRRQIRELERQLYGEIRPEVAAYANDLVVTVCAHCRRNPARYIDQDGELTCATCPVHYHLDSIRIQDVQALLRLCRDFAENEQAPGLVARAAHYAHKIREIIGRKP